MLEIVINYLDQMVGTDPTVSCLEGRGLTIKRHLDIEVVFIPHSILRHYPLLHYYYNITLRVMQ